MAGASDSIVMASVAIPVPPELVALIVTLSLPGTVGVPVMTPVLAVNESPTGNGVAL